MLKEQDSLHTDLEQDLANLPLQSTIFKEDIMISNFSTDLQDRESSKTPTLSFNPTDPIDYLPCHSPPQMRQSEEP